MVQSKKQAANSVHGAGAKRPVNQYDMDGKFIVTWESIDDASKKIGKGVSTISRACMGKYKHAGGFKWKYVDDYNIDGEIWKEVSYEDCEPILTSNKGRFLQNNGQKRTGHVKGGYSVVSIKSKETGKFRDLRAHRVIIAAFQGEKIQQ